MSIDYYSCAVCGDAFPDVIDYGYCANCEETLCSHCRDEMGKTYGVLGEDHEKADIFGENAPKHCTECVADTFTIDEKMDRLLISLTDEEREVLAKKLSSKGNA